MAPEGPFMKHLSDVGLGLCTKRSPRTTRASWTMAAFMILILAAARPAAAFQEEYALCFEDTFSFNSLQLFIKSDTNATGTVNVPGIAFTQPFTVTAGVATNVTVPISALVTGSDQVQNLGVQIVANKRLVV